VSNGIAPTITGLRIPAARASAKAAAICCWNSPFSASPPTAGCEKRRKQPEVLKLRYGDIKKKLSGDRVWVVSVHPQPVTFPYHPPKTINILRIIIICILVG
jgi:hypothetical protein